MKTWMAVTVCLIACAITPVARGQVQYGANAEVGKYAEVNGIKVYYEIYGKGEPLLLLHGNGGSIAGFSSQIPELATHFEVIAVDSRAQGKSSDANVEITYALMASDMSALIDALHLGSVYVVGWSDGGNIGLELALAHPEQVKKLVTFGANYTHVDYGAPADKVKMAPDDPRVARTKATVTEAKKSTPTLTPEVRKKLDDLMEKYPNLTTANLAKIECPVLVVAGDHDAIRMEQTISLYRSLPHAQLWIVPGATHFVAMEQPQWVNREVEEFLSTPYRDISTYYWMKLVQ